MVSCHDFLALFSGIGHDGDLIGPNGTHASHTPLIRGSDLLVGIVVAPVETAGGTVIWLLLGGRLGVVWSHFLKGMG